MIGRIRQFIRESARNDPANTGCAVLLAALVLVAAAVVLAQATDGWIFVSALVVFPLWFLVRNRLGR